MAQARTNRLAERDSIGREIADRMRRAWTRYWTRSAERAAIAALDGLDDRALKDLGLDRSEVESAVRGSPPCERRISWASPESHAVPRCC